MTQTTEYRDVLVFHLFGGMGAGAKGFNQGFARVGNLETRSRCIRHGVATHCEEGDSWLRLLVERYGAPPMPAGCRERKAGAG